MQQSSSALAHVNADFPVQSLDSNVYTYMSRDTENLLFGPVFAVLLLVPDLVFGEDFQPFIRSSSFSLSFASKSRSNAVCLPVQQTNVVGMILHILGCPARGDDG